VILVAEPSAKWGKLTQPICKEIIQLQKGIKIGNELVVGGLFQAKADMMDAYLITSTKTVAAKRFCKCCKCRQKDIPDLNFSFEENRRQVVCSQHEVSFPLICIQGRNFGHTIFDQKKGVPRISWNLFTF
jgi:hypothetical protein